MEQPVEELPDFLKIPKPLQEKFFSAVAEEVRELVERMDSMPGLIDEVKAQLSSGVRVLAFDEGWRELSAAVVDGSDVPAVDDRIGLRYGLYAVAYKLFRGLDSVEGGEGFFGDRLSGKISLHRESFLKILDLATTYYERLTASHILERQKPDLLIVDGSFFGYRAGCSMIKDEPLGWRDNLTGEVFEKVYDLISRINELTVKILESKRSVGVIKRVPTMAIDGYICYRHGLEKGVELADRSILSLIMRRGEVFDYGAVFGTDVRYDVYSWFRQTAREEALSRKGREEVLRKAEHRVKVQLVADLTDWSRERGGSWKQYEEHPIVAAARSTRRVFLRTVEDLPPICLELPEKMPEDFVNKVLSYVYATANPATGLPLPLDLVDELVSLPRGIGREFVNEIEAELVRRGVSKESLLAVFSRYNPQKDEP
ncbi:MAG: DNA double-strand break repair nuclease NurA [Candidatus Caldarchaeum sp.]|nr:DNA double-strand break repair nuclease NurA [Candidatus Caldarchaeum sp.]MDW8359124.1 DNA double-strand break repair nuclease NurA [Candidatus Caldarchaeum sp.]